MMDALKRFFSNPWTKRGFSLLTIPYGVMLFWFAYTSLFYDITVTSKPKFGACLILMCVASFAVMFYTRKTVLTTVMSTLPLICLLPIALLNFGNWVLLVPIVLVSVPMFFLCGAGEGGKTMLGTTILLIYLLGTLAYFAFTSVLASSIERNVAERGVSPSGQYRYSLVYTHDKSDGSTYVTMEPNTFDLHYPGLCCVARGYEKTVFITRPLSEVTLEWKTEKRTDITAALIKEDVTFILNDAQITKLGWDKTHTETIPVRNFSQAQLDALKIVLPSLSGKEVKVPEGKKLYTEDTMTLGIEKLREIGWAPTRPTKASELSDAQLTTLGVPAEGDVLYVDGKPQFRYYVAILEGRFDKSARTLDIF